MAVLRHRGRPAGRRGTAADLLVVGLGNPGTEYEGSRHNLGAAAVVRLAERSGQALRPERGTQASVARLPGAAGLAVLAVPVTYMNDSGVAVASLLRRCSVADLGQLVVVHDELDLPVGRVKVKQGGGIAGHNGLRSIAAHVHGSDFTRVRIGIGRPSGRAGGAAYVLGRPPRPERDLLDVALELAADALEVILAEGADAAMNRFNG